MPVASPLTGTARIAQKDLDNYVKALAGEPRNVAQAELQKLLEAGEARLPEGAASVLKDALWALQNDAWDPTKKSSLARPAPAKIGSIQVERERSMDGSAVQSTLGLVVTGKAEPNAQVIFQNKSRSGQPQVGAVTAGPDGSFSFRANNQHVWFHEQIAVTTQNPQTGALSDAVVQQPKNVEVQVWKDRRDAVDATQTERQEAPWVQAGLIENHRQLATAKDPAQHLVLAGKANSVPPNAKLEVVLDNKPQSVTAMPDGSFLFDVKGVKPGTQLELRVVDGGMVSVQRFAVAPLKFDPNRLVAATQGVPYDRVRGGKAAPSAEQSAGPSAAQSAEQAAMPGAGKGTVEGPFLRFALDQAVDPGSTVVVTNHTTGKSFEATADAGGRIDVEVAAHAGDALGFVCKDAAGNVAQAQLENWAVPATPIEDTRLKQLLCGNKILGEQADEIVALLQKQPTSVHRDLVERFFAGKLHAAADQVAGPAELKKLKGAVASLYSGSNDVRTNATNPEPREPIVIGARIIKPRFMDASPQANRDPIEVEGKAEPFSTVEIRNASMQGSPVIGTVTADKNGHFKFVGRDESKFLHGDQIFVKATDQGGASSKAALAKTCAYELQIWQQQPREVLVELPHATDTRQPFLDMAKVTHGREPIAPNGKSQVFTFAGAAGSVEPNAILRVTTRSGETCEAVANKDGSFKLPVGNFQPGEPLTLMVIDTNGQTAQSRVSTAPLKFDAKIAASLSGVPYQRFGASAQGDKVDPHGPFLDFKGENVVDPFSILVVKNNSTGKTVEMQADENGSLAFTFPGVHAGDSLAFSVKDPAGNVAPGAIENHIVPSTPLLSKEMQELECQHTFLPEHTTALLGLLAREPSAVNRSAFDSILQKGVEAFAEPKDYDKLKKAVAQAYAGDNDVRNHAENPAPKRPIVIDADIIKPRFMDAQPTAGRDPLEVRGKAEPFAFVEIRNASQPGFPALQTVQADKNGDWQVSFRDESKFLHGDQLLLRARDQGGAVSKDQVVTTCAYELQIWNNPPRTEKIKLEKDTDTRPPFIDMSKVAHQRQPIAKDGKEQVYVVQGQAMASEPNAVVRVTNKKGEAYETKVKIDGSFELKVGNYEPGESLTLHAIDGNGQVTQQRVNTPALKFDPQKLIETGEGAPFVRLQKVVSPESQSAQQGGAGHATETRSGPFLRFTQDAAVDPFTWVKVKNNSTGASFAAQADEQGRIDLEIHGVHTGDSLTFTAEDPAGNKAPGTVVNHIVPGAPRPNARLADLSHQQVVSAAHVEEMIALLTKSPTAANRGLVEEWLKDGHTTFQAPADKAKVESALARIFVGNNDVRTDTTNPAPKEPVVLDARIIKPRVMDQGSVAGRDPLEVFGTAEPFSFVEIRNASVPGAPSLGRVQADDKGEWKLTNRDESKFLHGDQLLIRSVDQGSASSKEVLSKTCQYELQVWNSTNRTELVRLPETTDTRAPFLDTSKVKQGQTLATKQKPQTFTTFEGGPLSAEPRSVIRFEGKNGVLSEAKVKDDGSFKIDVGGYVPGESLKATVFNAGGQVVSHSFRTEALKFDPQKLLQAADGPPYQKLMNGKPVEGGPFLKLQADEAAFPGALLEVTNHATGKTEVFTADPQGSFDVELKGVHAFDLLTFKVKDAAGNEAPNVQRAWQVPAESRGVCDPTIVALTSQRPVTAEVVDLLVSSLRAQPTPQHRQLVDDLLRQHPDWFTGGKKELEGAVKDIFKGPPEMVPDATNPAPKRPIVLGAEIVKPRVMDQGSAPRDPLTVSGLAEPLSTIEIHNGSVPGRPLIGTVQVGEDGKFAFQSTDESKFLHGDQIVVTARDAGGAKSDAVVSKAKAFELQIWNQTNRRDKVALTGANADTRDPFLQANLVKTEPCDGTKQGQGSFVLVGAAGATEVFGTVSVTIGENTYKAEAGLDGSFRLPVPGLELGKPVEMVAGDPNGRMAKAKVTPSV